MPSAAKLTQAFLVLMFLLTHSFSHSDWVNNEISRTIDATEQIVRIQTEYVISEGKGEYVVAFPEDWGNKLAFVSATVGSKKDAIAITKKHTRNGLLLYEVNMGEKPAKILTVKAVVVHPYTLLPAEINQDESQYVVYEDTALVSSPYPTQKQTTKMKLANKKTESVEPPPTRATGSSLTWGPISNTKAFGGGKFGSLRVHYLNHFPFVVAHDVSREIEVSNWGNIAVEEMYEVKHTGAKLKGGFSRIDYMMHQSSSSPSFRSLKASIPAQASNIYYRDQIGNISTSSLTLSSSGELKFEIQPRFPMFGGWKTEWYQGWNLPSEYGLTHSGSSYKLTLDFGIPFDDIWVEDYYVKVILPEGATNVKTSVPFDVEESRSHRSTYLDTPVMGGRPIVVFRKTMVVKEHNQPFTVTYTFNSMYMLHEPIVCILFFLAFFLVAIVVSRLDLSLVKEKDRKEKPE